MPELPEVETTLRGISPFLIDQTITSIVVRQPQLRLPVTPGIHLHCINKKIRAITRRAKYLLIHLSEGYLLIHLGMSGHLRVVDSHSIPAKHDHIDLCLTNGRTLRYQDPRRFGLWIYLAENPAHHRLLTPLGPEPLLEDFHAEYLIQQARNKKQPIKSFIMDNRMVVGVGNIYATESLFFAGIHPKMPAGEVSKKQLINLCKQIKNILQQAIDAGGTTLRDFYAADGKPGYFSLALNAYGRKNLPCFHCHTLLQTVVIAGRNSYFCPQCQPW